MTSLERMTDAQADAIAAAEFGGPTVHIRRGGFSLIVSVEKVAAGRRAWSQMVETFGRAEADKGFDRFMRRLDELTARAARGAVLSRRKQDEVCDLMVLWHVARQ
jgi:hypothetical protein